MQIGVSVLSKNNIMSSSVGHDETDRYKQSHLDLHCLHVYLYQSTGLKGDKKSILSFVWHEKPDRF